MARGNTNWLQLVLADTKKVPLIIGGELSNVIGFAAVPVLTVNRGGGLGLRNVRALAVRTNKVLDTKVASVLPSLSN